MAVSISHLKVVGDDAVDRDKTRRIAGRRFGPTFNKPCNDPEVIECAMWECQLANRCVRAKP